MFGKLQLITAFCLPKIENLLQMIVLYINPSIYDYKADKIIK